MQPHRLRWPGCFGRGGALGPISSPDLPRTLPAIALQRKELGGRGWRLPPLTLGSSFQRCPPRGPATFRSRDTPIPGPVYLGPVAGHRRASALRTEACSTHRRVLLKTPPAARLSHIPWPRKPNALEASLSLITRDSYRMQRLVAPGCRTAQVLLSQGLTQGPLSLHH